MKTDTETLMAAQRCYMAMARFRKDRERNKRFTYGDQWCDKIDVGGRMISEEQFIIENGSWPLKNNLIRRLVRNVIGVYSSQSTDVRCTARDAKEHTFAEAMTALLKCNSDLNRLSALNVRTLEEFLISGLAVQKKWFGVRNGQADCWTDPVQPCNFFVDSTMRDFRAWDCKLIGEIHDVTPEQLYAQLGDEVDPSLINEAYYSDAAIAAAGDFGFAGNTEKGFLYPATPGLLRVIEVWRKVLQPREITLPSGRKRRWVDERWRYQLLTPGGEVLAEGDSPYAHGRHPYIVKAYPMIDGEIHSFVADVIDQQKYTNRLITMYDWILRSSAKGALLVPEDCIPRGMSLQEFSDMWSQFNGVIAYRPSINGEVPRQVSANSTNIGISELLKMQLGFFEDISGVSGALEGRLDNAAMSAELYGQQTQNATTALLDVLGTFGEFVREGVSADISNMQQFYTNDDVKQLVGIDLSSQSMRTLRDAALELSISSANQTAATRQASNQMLIEIWKSGQITLSQLLEAGDFPFAAALKSQDIGQK